MAISESYLYTQEMGQRKSEHPQVQKEKKTTKTPNPNKTPV